MTQFADLLISGQFATGVAHYEDNYPGDEQSARIVLPITIEGRVTVSAIVDTGAPWCILAPEIVEPLRPTLQAGYEAEDKLMVRGTSYEGQLLRMRVGLEAQTGSSLEVEATVFVPTLPAEQEWPYPNFLGLGGFLNRIRLAIDPTENAFYFGAI